ncbi:MAG TPA: TetR/AcrR family transcriptional regulator [Anaerolinea sp.]|nr:TetR/AcrR family transcriptional regulator [Anaerolinea sp.]
MTELGVNTRKTILDAANRVVQKHGVERLTLELTAQEAGLSKGGLLYHFPSKEALIKGMIQDYLDRFTADFNATAQQEGGQTPGRWTRSYLYTTYEDKQRSPSMSSGLLAAVATNPTLLSPVQQTYEEWVRLLMKDGIDSTTAMIVRLAVDGLWMVDLFGFAPPDPVMRVKVLRALNEMIQTHPLESDANEESISSS